MNKESMIDYEKYIINKDGSVFGKYYNKELSTSTKRGGYIENSFKCKNGIFKTFDRHRVIWYYFNGEIPKGYEIGHKDCDPSNNSLDNLYLCSHKENMNNTITLERHKNSGRPPTPIKVFKNNNLVKEFPTCSDAARELNISRWSIYNSLNGISKDNNGYTFQLV